MKLHKSFIAKFIQASLFSCLSFSAYAQDVNSEENKPLVPSNEKEYEAAKAYITDNIDKTIKAIKVEEEKVKYDFETEGRPKVKWDETHSVFSHYNTPTENVRYYLFEIGSGDKSVNNLKLVNNTNLSSITEVFSDQHARDKIDPKKKVPGVNNLAYVENNGNITGLGTGINEPPINLSSKNNFYFQNNGEIRTKTTDPERAQISAKETMVLENKNKGYLHKYKISGNKMVLLNSGKLDDMVI